MEKQYAQAIAHMHATSDKDEATLMSGLVRHLKATGRLKLLPRIVIELKNLSLRAAKLAPTLEVATSSEEKGAKEVLTRQGVHVEHTIVNPSLIRGWRARSNGLLWDRSAKRALTDIYKQITN
jgi:F0F1-type ATP synthase delta subunit